MFSKESRSGWGGFFCGIMKTEGTKNIDILYTDYQVT